VLAIWFSGIVPSTVLGTIQRELRSSRRCDNGYAEVDRRDAGQTLGLLAFLPEEGEGEVDALNLTEPCLVFGAGSAGQQVVLGTAVGHPGRGDPGRQVITVVREGTRELQELPASSDAFVWLRLYQAEMKGLTPRGRRQPLWWTLRRPARPLTYHAVHRMFERVNEKAGSAATLRPPPRGRDRGRRRVGCAVL
jgi:hypothetical protein